MTRVLVLGGAGMLGHKLCQVLSPTFEVHATFRSRAPAVAGVFERVRAIEGFDARDLGAVRDVVRSARPDATVNAIGIVKQLAEAKDPIASITVNSLLPHHVAAACREVGALMIQVSTDCVFSGRRGGYHETDQPDPVDLYGRSKLLGEVEDGHALTIRTSIIGRELATHHGLVEWFLGEAGGSVRGYAKSVFSGLTTGALAAIIARVIGEGSPRGLWHVSSEPLSKYELLRALKAAFALNIGIERDEEETCDRSLNSDRFWEATGFARPTWDVMIAALAADRTPYAPLRRTSHDH